MNVTSVCQKKKPSDGTKLINERRVYCGGCDRSDSSRAGRIERFQTDARSHSLRAGTQAGEDGRDFPILPSAAPALDSTERLSQCNSAIIRAVLSGETSRAQGRGRMQRKGGEKEKGEMKILPRFSSSSRVLTFCWIFNTLTLQFYPNWLRILRSIPYSRLLQSERDGLWSD